MPYPICEPASEIVVMNQDNDRKDRSLDVLGIKPIGDAVSKLTDGMINGAAAFLSRICLPAAEEFGLLVHDRVRAWRAANLTAMLLKSEHKLKQDDQATVHAHPRIVSTILEEGSWIDDAEVQDMWGGLLSSSCTEDGDDDSNLVFVNLLSQISRLQARILRYTCENAPKKLSPNGLVVADGSIDVSIEEICNLAGDSDIHRIDRELDHLRDLGLFEMFDTGFSPVADHLEATLTPSTIGLHLYVRAQGSRLPPDEYFGLTSIDEHESEESEDS